jgi:hypothetical protein
MNRTLVVLSLVLCGCAPPPAPDPDPVFSVKFITTYDATGVGSATCRSGSRVTGGGCSCKGIGDPLFSGSPAGNSYVCGCYHFGAGAERGVEAYAACLSSNVPGTVSQSLVAADPQPDQQARGLLAELRRMQASR